LRPCFRYELLDTLCPRGHYRTSQKWLDFNEKKFIAENNDGLARETGRDDRTAIELFLACIRRWEAELQRRLDDGKSNDQI